MTDPEAMQERGAHQEFSTNGNGSTPTPGVDPEIVEFITNHADAISDGLFVEDEERRIELGQQIADEATAQLPNHDPEDQPVEKFLKKAIRGAYVERLRTLSERGEIFSRLDSTIQKMVGSTNGNSKLIGAIFGSEPEEEARETKTPEPVDKGYLEDVLPTTRTENESVLHQAIKYLEETGQKRNQYIFEQYFIADVPPVSIGKDLDIGEAGITSIIKRVCAKIEKEAEIETGNLLEDSSTAPIMPPQEKVMSWMSWSDRKGLPLNKTDILFALGRLPRWNLQHVDKEGSKKTILKAPTSFFESTNLAPVLEQLMPDVDDTTTMEVDEDQIRLVIEGKVAPKHFQILAIVDYILEKDSYKTFHRLRIASGSTHDYRDMLLRAKKLSEAISIDEIGMSMGDDGEIYELTEVLSMFSDSEKKVLAMINRDSSDIGAELGMESSTARTHVHNMMNKTGLDRSSLAILSYEIGYLDFDEETEASVEQDPKPSLSKRERQCVALVAGGMHYEDIATELTLSMPTVRTHLHNSYVKLSAKNAATASLSAYVNGQIGLPEKVRDFIANNSTPAQTDEKE